MALPAENESMDQQHSGLQTESEEQRGLSVSIVDYLRKNKQITDSQLEEARYGQEHRGGSIEDHLYRLRAVSETDLLQAVESCHGWRTIALTDRRISTDMLQVLPGSVAWEKKILPFAENPDTMSISVACQNPDDPVLKDDVIKLFQGRQVELYAAVGLLLDSAIITHYRNSSLVVTAQGSESQQSETEQPVSLPINQTVAGTVLLISPGGEGDEFLARALAYEGHMVVISRSAEEALKEIEDRRPWMVLIHDSDHKPYKHLIRELSRVVPNCDARFFCSAADLFTAVEDIDESTVLLTANLHLFTSAMATRVGKTGDAVKIGPFVDRLCRRLHLLPRDRLVTVCAAYLQDLTDLYFGNDSQLDRETVLFRLQSTAGDSLVYPPSVPSLLRKMYLELSRLSQIELHSVDVRNGNILTIVDLYFKRLATDERLSIHRYNTIERNLRAQIGNLLLPDVTESFLELLQDDVVHSSNERTLCQILILDEANIVVPELAKHVDSGWFAYTVSDSVDEFLHRSRRLNPDFLVIAAGGNPGEVQRLVEELVAQGLAIHDVPTFVLYESDDSSHVSPLLNLGIFDVIRFAGDCDVLLVKLERILSEREKESLTRLHVLQDLGTHGTLAHMNVIDLLQAMGPGNKTLRISVTAHGNQMTMYLSKGKLLYAECESKTAVDAIIESLTWSNGIWSVDHIDESDLPEPNIHRSIDSILIEGCHLLDEAKRRQSPQTETADNPLL